MKQVGVQTNIKAGVTGSVGAYTPIPPTPPSPPSNPSAIVSGAGTPTANGTYSYTGTNDGRPFYNLVGTDPFVSAISWDNNLGLWAIYSFADLYESDGDYAFPWLVASWLQNGGDPPSPTVTQGS